MLSSFRRDWYLATFRARFVATRGNEFEDLVVSLCRIADPSFINPDPMGAHGDGGSDGLLDNGRTVHACYGSRAVSDMDRTMAAKISSDLARARLCHPAMRTWRFITNSPVGYRASRAIMELRREQEQVVTELRVDIQLWQTADDVWSFVTARASGPALDAELARVFPGCPSEQSPQMVELLPIIDRLSDGVQPAAATSPIRPVLSTKMDYNQIPEATQVEFNQGRLSAETIDSWFDRNADPTLRDRCANRFREVYEEARMASDHPSDVLYRLGVALAGADFGADHRVKASVNAVTVYFFDTCDIFEDPSGAPDGGERDAAADEGDQR